MGENSDEFNLDNLRVDEEEVRSPAIFPLSVVVCETEFVEQVDNVSELIRRIKDRLLDRYAYKKGERKKFKEGFLGFSTSSDNLIECIFAKETPTKINYEADDLEMHTERLRLINPSFSVRIKVIVNQNGAEVVLFGGSDIVIMKALRQMNFCIRHCLKGGHRTFLPHFSKEDMNVILKRFGLNVEYIWIHPGESKKFMKIVEKKINGEIRKIPEYVVHAKLRGYRITGSPITISLIDETGIYLREIQGRLSLGAGVKITARVSATGKILFYIPENLITREETIHILAERLYEQVVTERRGPKQSTMGEYLGEKD